MTYVGARFKVADFARWQQSFAEGAAIREANGSRGGLILRGVNDPNEVILLIDWADPEQGRRVGQSPEVQELQRRGGVISPLEPLITAEQFQR